jgi:hypothetical protein
VPHQRLLRKIQSYGIRGKIYKWIENFLDNRKQRVIIDLSTKPHAVHGQVVYLAYIESEMRPGSRLNTIQHYRVGHMKRLL